MPDNWGYVFSAYGLAAVALLGYWRRLVGRAKRLAGLVQPGSLKWEPKSLDLSFTLSDGKASVPVKHKGTPPDLFAEGRGAVVEGSWTKEGYFKASLILAKHSEEYKAPHDGAQPGYKELLKSLRGDGTTR